MEPVGSFTQSQKPPTRPYLKPHESRPYLHPNSRRSILILSFHLRQRLPSGLFPSGLPTKTLYAPILSPILPHAPPLSFFLIWSTE